MTASRRAIVFFLLASVFFGGTFVAAKAGQAYIPPLLFVALRFDIAAIVLLGYAFLAYPRAELVPGTRGDLAGILATGVLAIGLANGLLFVGQGYVTSAVGAIVFSLVPIFTPLFAGVVLSDERLSPAGAIGTVVGLFGVALVIGIDPASLREAVGGGAAIVFAGAISAALGAVLIRRAETTTASTVRTAWALPISALVLHAMSVAAGESPSTVEWSPAALVALVYLGVFAGAIAYIAYFGLLEEVGAIRSSLTFYVTPVVATLGGRVFLAESISASAIVGFAVIVVGFAIVGHETLAAAIGRTRSDSRRSRSAFSRSVSETGSERDADPRRTTIRTSTGDRYVTGRGHVPDGD